MPVNAHTLGGTPHLSPLLRKAGTLGMADAGDLLHLAVARGCHHYMPPDYPAAGVPDPGKHHFSDEELGIAMISAAQRTEPRLIRCAAQLLSGPNVDAVKLARLARMERCTPLLAYIARHGLAFDTARRDFWAALLERMPAMPPRTSEFWPHSSRFMLQAGYQRGGGVPPAVWLRPRAQKEAA